MLSSVETLLALLLMMKNRLINLQNIKSYVYIFFYFHVKKHCKTLKNLSLCVIRQTKSLPNLAIFSIRQNKSRPNLAIFSIRQIKFSLNIPFWPFAKFNPSKFNLIKVSLIKLCSVCAIKNTSDTCSLLPKQTLSNLIGEPRVSLIINFEQVTKSFLI